MILWMLADTVFSLILGREDLRGEFCLQQYSNPLKYNICHLNINVVQISAPL
jgi:hypothetical protein